MGWRPVCGVGGNREYMAPLSDCSPSAASGKSRQQGCASSKKVGLDKRCNAWLHYRKSLIGLSLRPTGYIGIIPKRCKRSQVSICNTSESATYIHVVRGQNNS